MALIPPSLDGAPSLDPAALGLQNPGPVSVGLAAPLLVERALARGEGVLTDAGALTALTGARTGRSPRDKYVVEEPSVRDLIWRGPNQPLDEASFDRLLGRVRSWYQGRELFVCDGSACADPAYALPVRVVCDRAWHALFARCLVRGPVANAALEPLTIFVAADMHADPALDGTRGATFIALHLGRRTVLIGGTHYAGE